MARAAAAARPGSMPVLQASDRDAGAMRMAQANAERAGVADCIEFSCRAVSASQPSTLTRVPAGSRSTVIMSPTALVIIHESCRRDHPRFYGASACI